MFKYTDLFYACIKLTNQIARMGSHHHNLLATLHVLHNNLKSKS